MPGRFNSGCTPASAEAGVRWVSGHTGSGYPARMVTFNELSDRRAMITLPTRTELRAMLSQTSIAITVILCVTLFAIAALAAVIILALNGHDTAVIITLVGAPLITILTTLTTRLKAVHEDVKAAQNGTTEGK